MYLHFEDIARARYRTIDIANNENKIKRILSQDTGFFDFDSIATRGYPPRTHLSLIAIDSACLTPSQTTGQSSGPADGRRGVGRREGTGAVGLDRFWRQNALAGGELDRHGRGHRCGDRHGGRGRGQ